MESEACAPVRAYIIQTRKEATTLDVIVDPFSLFDVFVHAFIDPGSTHSYIYTSLVPERNIPVELKEFDVQVTNPLGHSLIVNQICKDCALNI